MFTESELNRLESDIRAVEVPLPILRRLEFFASQFEYIESAATQFEYKTKDTVKLAGIDWHQVSGAETGKDKLKKSARRPRTACRAALMTTLTFIKAMAYFRGSRQVEMEDVRQIIPFVLHDKLVQVPIAPSSKPQATQRSAAIKSAGFGACSIWRALNTIASN